MYGAVDRMRISTMIEVTGPLAGAATTVMVVKMKEPENMCPPALRYGHFGDGTRMAVVDC